MVSELFRVCHSIVPTPLKARVQIRAHTVLYRDVFILRNVMRMHHGLHAASLGQMVEWSNSTAFMYNQVFVYVCVYVA